MIRINSCLLCGSSDSKGFYKYGAPNKIKVYNRICANCGLVFQSPRQDIDELREYYAAYLEQSQPDMADIPIGFEEHILAVARLRLNFLKSYLREGDRVLDIGCSFGAFLKVLREESGFSLKLTGINPEKNLAEFGRRKYNLNIMVGMFEDIDLQPESFDVVILDNVIEHFDDPVQAVRRIHHLLSPKGRIFIATNNLDEPHGFLWQNFFPEHTVTFSPTTLRALLESQGFAIIAQDTKGHTTYEGYRYPYQYCVGGKLSGIPIDYCYKEHGDDAQEMIKISGEYIKNYYRKRRVAKRFYEATLEKPKGYLRSLKYNAIRALRHYQIPSRFDLYNHTLPPEEFFYRRVLVAECSTGDDVNLAQNIIQQSGLGAENIILTLTSSGKYKMKICPSRILRGKRPPELASGKEVWQWILSNFTHVDEGLVLRLNHADLPKDTLKRYHAIFRSKGLKFLAVEFSFFTGARLEFLNQQCLQQITKENRYIEDKELSHSGGKRITWPQKEDYEYYFKEQFQRYYSIPQSITLDLNPHCNKRCDKCQFHSPRSPYADKIEGAQMMPVDLACKVLKEASTWKPKPSLSPNFSGEPLIYPHLYEVLDYARKLGYCIAITTNGVALTAEASKQLLTLGIDSLLVSIDAVCGPTYDLLQAPGGLDRVKGNLLRFLELRGKKKTPQVGVHFVMEERNREEFEPFLKFWGTKVDYVSRAIRQEPFGALQLTMSPFLPLGRRQACFAPWKCLYIRGNGDIGFCGFDFHNRESGLNVTKQSLLDIWNSEEFWRWREAQLTGNQSLIYCRACPDWAGMHNITVSKGNWTVSRSPIQEIYYPPDANKTIKKIFKKVMRKLDFR